MEEDQHFSLSLPLEIWLVYHGLQHESIPDDVRMPLLERSSLLELHFQPYLDHDPSPDDPQLSLVYLPLLNEVRPHMLDNLDQDYVGYVALADLLDLLRFQLLIEQLLLQVFDDDRFHHVEGFELSVLEIELVLVLDHLLPLLVLEMDVLASLGGKQVVLGVVLR